MYRGHDGLGNCVHTAMSKRLGKPKTFAAANAIYSHKFAGQNTLASAFVAKYDGWPIFFFFIFFLFLLLFLLLSAFFETDNL